MLKPISFRISYFATCPFSSEEVVASIWVEAAFSISNLDRARGKFGSIDRYQGKHKYRSSPESPHHRRCILCRLAATCHRPGQVHMYLDGKQANRENPHIRSRHSNV